MVPKKKQVASDELSPKALAALVNEKFGEGTLRFANDPHFEVQRVPTGILSLDHLLGGGFPRGRHVEIYGGYAVGKTATVYRTIASAQSQGLTCGFLDVEKTFDPQFAAKQGVDLEKLVLHEQDDHGQRVIQMMETMLRTGDYGVIALDSIASLLPKSELDSDMEGGTYGTAQAKMMSEALRRLTAANRTTVLIYINQLRDAIGMLFGKRSVTSGGRAMSFYASTRLEMTQTESLKKSRRVIDPKTLDEQTKDVAVGHRVLVRVDKDKSGGAHNSAMTSLVFSYALDTFDHIEDLIYVGRQTEWVVKRGTKWWVDGYEDEAQVGRERFATWLRKNKAVQQDLEQRILEADRDDTEDEEG